MGKFKLEVMDERFSDFLKDESKKSGYASTISFPVSEEEVSDTVAYLSKEKIRTTIQGARTGLTAGAVPAGGHVMNLCRLDKVIAMSADVKRDCYLLKVQPGVVLSKLRDMLDRKAFDVNGWSENSISSLVALKHSPNSWFFPPDPTEDSATIGGMIACNSSGACSFYYGPVREYIESLDIILPDSSKLELSRGGEKASGNKFSLQSDSGKLFEGLLPEYRMPKVKNASGYYTGDSMDLVDLFIGSEGTIGIITGITLRILPKPASIWGMLAFLPSERQALGFVCEVRNIKEDGYRNMEIAKPVAIEYFNHNTLELLRSLKNENRSFSEIPDISPEYVTAVYVEFHGGDEEQLYSMVMRVSEIYNTWGGNDEAVWVATNVKEMKRLKSFRHTVPEAINNIIAERKKVNQGITKLGTDMAVPDEKLEAVMEMYNRDLEAASLDSVIFGHIGNNHVHVNILPRSEEEYGTGWNLYQKWASNVIDMGGTISAEHGVGKLKSAMLRKMYGEKGIIQMESGKRVFDPDGILNLGNLFYNEQWKDYGR